MSGLLCLGLALAGVSGFLAWLVMRLSYRDGRQDERHDSDTSRHNAAVDAAYIRDRLVRDAAFARRVRDRFSR